MAPEEAAEELEKPVSRTADFLRRPHSANFARLLLIAAVAVPFLATVAVYHGTLSQWFFTDDFIWLEAAQNPDTGSFLRGAFDFPRGPTPYWRPLVDLYFFCMYRVFGLEAAAYHAVNLVLHGATAALVVLVTARVARSLATGAVAGLVFAVSPHYWTSVVWVSGITTLLSALLLMCSCLLFLRYVSREGSKAALGLGCVSFGLAIMAKEDSVVLPLILSTLGLALLRPKTIAEAKHLALALAPFFLIAAAFALVQISLSQSSSEPRAYELGWHAAPNFVDALRWLSLPVLDRHGGWVGAAQWLAFGTSLLLVGAGIARRHWEVAGFYGASLVALLPLSVFVIPFNPRWVYLASIPYCAFLAAVLMVGVRWLQARSPMAAATALCLALAGLGWWFVPKTLDAIPPLSRGSEQMEDVKLAIEAGCSDLDADATLYLFPLPINDLGYAAPAMSRILYPHTRVLRVQPPMPVPRRVDCVVYADDYRPPIIAAQGDRYNPGPYWRADPTVTCEGALSWRDARSYVGRIAMVRGPIAGITSSGSDLQVSLGGDPGFVVVLRQNSRIAASDLSIGSQLCAAGPVQRRGQIPVLLVDRPSGVALQASSDGGTATGS